MRQRTLGQLKTPVSCIGYGAMSLADFYGPTDDEASHAILSRCLDLGISHLDTSNVYGRGKSEARIGAFLAKQGARLAVSGSNGEKLRIFREQLIDEVACLLFGE